jgi:hypothetical protein
MKDRTSGEVAARKRTDPTGASVSPLPIWIEQLEPGGVTWTTRNAAFGE